MAEGDEDGKQKAGEIAERLRSAIERRSKGGRGELPGDIYHYTTAGGLHGIIGGQKLWATDVRFLNDSSEYT